MKKQLLKNRIVEPKKPAEDEKIAAKVPKKVEVQVPTLEIIRDNAIRLFYTLIKDEVTTADRTVNSVTVILNAMKNLNDSISKYNSSDTKTFQGLINGDALNTFYKDAAVLFSQKSGINFKYLPQLTNIILETILPAHKEQQRAA